jgi:hypothetical protein
MRLSTLLIKHLADAANIQESNSPIILICVQLFGRYEFSKGPLQFGILVKKIATDQKRWQISKNDLCRFDSQFSI